MYISRDVILFVLMLLCDGYCMNDEYLHNEWVVRIQGGPRLAKRIARDFGYSYHGPVVGFKDTYLFQQEYFPDVYQKRGSFDKAKQLNDDERVIWVEQQYVKSRQKRDFLDYGEIYLIDGKRNNILEDNTIDNIFNDELWSQEWYLQDTRTRRDLPKLDLNVLPVYKAGITGKGVRVTILDDGIEYTHEDLKNNYDPDISWDCNENDADPYPRYDKKHRNSHGTRCAGEVAMSANNVKCGVGVAYNARIGGVKLLDGLVNDRIEGTALGYAYKLVDIYSASWGPNDDGKTVDGPGTLAREALERGIREGRDGLGSIYVWASGNGGSKGDNCNCDGYLTSPYTISIGSASQRGEFPWYGEECASTLAVTYSSGAYQDQMIATTDLENGCTIKHTGTSASAPLAAGIIALALEVNPKLTWRDVQHLIVWTSEYSPVSDNKGWQQNAAGFWFNTRFGFGLMNAHGLVLAASNWTTVPEKYICTIPAKPLSNSTLRPMNPIHLSFEANNCVEDDTLVDYLEHVEVRTSIDYTVRGQLEIYLKSPVGTKVQLLGRRKLDKSKHGFNNWTFMSVMTWGENPKGLWDLEINDPVGKEKDSGQVYETFLILHGTKQIPNHMIGGARKYNKNYNRINKNIDDNEDNMIKTMSNYDYIHYK